MLDSTNNAGVLEGVTDSMANVLRTFAHNSTGVAQIESQNFLCFFLGECTDLDEIHGTERNATADDEAPTVVPLRLSKNQHSVYPNPNRGIFTIDVNTLEVDKVSLFDLNGREVFSIHVENEQFITVETQNLQAGIYILQLQANGNLVESSKIVKQ